MIRVTRNQHLLSIGKVKQTAVSRVTVRCWPIHPRRPPPSADYRPFLPTDKITLKDARGLCHLNINICRLLLKRLVLSFFLVQLKALEHFIADCILLHRCCWCCVIVYYHSVFYYVEKNVFLNNWALKALWWCFRQKSKVKVPQNVPKIIKMLFTQSGIKVKWLVLYLNFCIEKNYQPSV